MITGLPAELAGGVSSYLDSVAQASHAAQGRAESLIQDFEEFAGLMESGIQYTKGQYEAIKAELDANIAGIEPLRMNLGPIGTGSILLAPVVPTRLYNETAATKGGLLGKVNNAYATAGSGISSALQGIGGAHHDMNMADMEMANAERYPADVALKLMEQERADQAYLDRIAAGQTEPNFWDRYAPTLAHVGAKTGAFKSIGEGIGSLFDGPSVADIAIPSVASKVPALLPEIATPVAPALLKSLF